MNLITIVIYSTISGKEPYADWENKIDTNARAIIKNRLDRLQLGNFGDAKIIKGGAGIWELRIDYGPGYRIYFGKQGNTTVLLLLGGNKATQERNIEKAKRYWLDGKDLL